MSEEPKEVKELETTAESDALLSVKQAAAALGISESAVHWHLSKGRMQARKEHNVFLIPRAAVEAFRLELPALRRMPSPAAVGTTTHCRRRYAGR